MSTCASNSAFTSSEALAEGSATSGLSGTKTGESSCGTLGGVSGRVLEGGTVASVVVVDGTVVATVLATVVTGAGMVVSTVVEGRLVSGEVVSTTGCVSAGGGGMVMGTVEEEVEVEDVELVCSTVLVGRTVSVDVVVGAGDEPTHARESNNHKSQSAGTENETIDLPSGATTCTVASQQEPSIGRSIVVSSSRTAVRFTVPFLAPATNWNPCTAKSCGNTKVVGEPVLNKQIDAPLVP